MDVYISLGSNLGCRLEHVESGIRAVCAIPDIEVELTGSSCLYESLAAYSNEPSRLYLNAAIRIRVAETTNMQRLMRSLLRIETENGRPNEHDKFTPRTLDLDLVAVLHAQTRTPLECDIRTISGTQDVPLTLPHPLAHERRFVLQPLHDINPHLKLTARSPTVEELLATLSKDATDGRSAPLSRIFVFSSVTLWREEDRPRLLRIVNLTDDSFCDNDKLLRDGKVDLERVQRCLLSALASGADAFDLGAESTRPGSSGVETETQIARLLPVLRMIREDPRLSHIPVSIDTRAAEVINKAAEIIPTIMVNDVSGLTADADMLSTVLSLNLSAAICHSRGTPENMVSLSNYKDVCLEVGRECGIRIERAMKMGVFRWRLMADPGIGFAKDATHNIALLTNPSGWLCQIPRGIPYMLSYSRKRFLEVIAVKEEFKFSREDFKDADLMTRRDALGSLLFQRLISRTSPLPMLIRLHDCSDMIIKSRGDTETRQEDTETRQGDKERHNQQSKTRTETLEYETETKTETPPCSPSSADQSQTETARIESHD